METKDFILSYSLECGLCVNWEKTKQLTEEELSQHEKDVKKWDKDHLYCRNYLINCLSNDLYDYYDQVYNKLERYERHWIKNMIQRKLDPRNMHVVDLGVTQ